MYAKLSVAALAASLAIASGFKVKVARQFSDTIMCQTAVYDYGEPCDNEAIPSYGSGYCADLALAPGICCETIPLEKRQALQV
jgi:hypothetical protein